MTEPKNKPSGTASDYLTVKKPFTALFIFALPIIIGNMFQQLYTLLLFRAVGGQRFNFTF